MVFIFLAYFTLYNGLQFFKLLFAATWESHRPVTALASFLVPGSIWEPRVDSALLLLRVYLWITVLIHIGKLPMRRLSLFLPTTSLSSMF